MAKKKAITIPDDAITVYERERIAQALSVMKKTNKHYKPVPKFRGGCKNC